MASAVPAPISPAPAAASDAGLLFEEHSERLFGYCLRFLGSRADAEDAVQTTFLYAHRALERGEVPELEYAWLHSIAKNVCRWHLRTLSRRGSLTTELDLDAMPGSAGDEIETRELRGELQDALASVPESQRKALVLREWHGLESHEIATQLGMSTTATYALLTRARRSLAKALTTSGQRPLLGIDLISMVGKLKALLAGGTAKVVATTVVAGSVALGGVAVERATDGGSPSRKTPSPVADRDTGVRTAPVVSPRQRGATATLPSTVATKDPARGRPVDLSPPQAATTASGSDQAPTAPGAAPAPPEAVTAPPRAGPTGDSVEATAPSLPAPPLPALPLPVPPLPAVKDVADPLLDDPLGLLPPVEVGAPPGEPVPPLGAVEKDLEAALGGVGG